MWRAGDAPERVSTWRQPWISVAVESAGGNLLKRALISIFATLGVIAVLLVAALYVFGQMMDRRSVMTPTRSDYSEVMASYARQWQAKDYVGAERILLDGLANEALAKPNYQFALHGSLADLYHRSLGDVAAAEKQYRAALVFDFDNEFPMFLDSRAELLIAFATLLDESGRYEEAIERFLEVQGSFRGQNYVDPITEARISMGLGIAYVHHKDFDRGEYYLEETVKRAEALTPPNLDLKTLAYNNLAWMYKRSVRYDKALEAAQKGIRIAEVVDNPQLLVTLYDTQAQILLALKRFEEALSYSEKSLTTLPDSDYMSAVHYRTHGNILAASNRTGDACKSLTKAQELYAKAGNEKERLATQQEATALAC
jgi:tetratricopeptide (TPR) repeat protein